MSKSKSGLTIKKTEKGGQEWIDDGKRTITKVKVLMERLVERVRKEQFNVFKAMLLPSKNSNILDVGVSSEEDIKGTNLFEKIYEYPKNLTLATIENVTKLGKMYPQSKVVRLTPGDKLPFRDNEFDIAVSWATLEHVGGYKDQERFLNEMIRVSKKVFVTTPYRGCIYEPHSGLFLIHWLPLEVFRRFCSIFGNKFWTDVDNLNPLYIKDIKKMKLSENPKILTYKMFGFLPSHLLILFKK